MWNTVSVSPLTLWKNLVLWRRQFNKNVFYKWNQCVSTLHLYERDVSPPQEVEITATSWVICSSCSVWSAGWCTVAFPVSRSPPPPHVCPLSPHVLMYLTLLPLRLEDPLRHQLRQGWFLALCDSDRVLLSVDVVDVPKQRLSLHVGGGAHHVSALSGRASRLTRLFFLSEIKDPEFQVSKMSVGFSFTSS